MQAIQTYLYEPGLAFVANEINGIQPASLPITTHRERKLIDSPFFKETKNPKEAEIFLYPEYMDRYLEGMNLQNKFSALPFYDEYESKHVFFSDHDHDQPYNTNSIWFRASMRRTLKDPKAVSFPYGKDRYLGRSMEDLGKIFENPFDQIYDTSFVGCVGKGIFRRNILISVLDRTRLNVKIKARDLFWGINRDMEDKIEFLESLAKSLTVLCPRGAGSNSIRFFETMSAGRVPVLISDQVVLPFEDLIDYSKFTIRIPEKMIANAGPALERIIERLGREKLKEMGRLARHAYVEHLALEHYPSQIHRIIRSFIPEK